MAPIRLQPDAGESVCFADKHQPRSHKIQTRWWITKELYEASLLGTGGVSGQLNTEPGAPNGQHCKREKKRAVGSLQADHI